MQPIVKVTLENERGLILAHKKSMQLVQLSGMSLAVQTSFASAVSEIARDCITTGQGAYMNLGVQIRNKEKYLSAAIHDRNPSFINASAGVACARRLVDELDIQYSDQGKITRLLLKIPTHLQFSKARIAEWKNYLDQEIPLSPYQENSSKDEQLKELAEKLRESESRYKLLTDTLPLMIFTTDPAGKITYYNKYAKEYFGTTLDQLNESLWTYHIHPEDVAPDTPTIWFNNVVKLQPNQGEFRLRNKQGALIWHQLVSVPLDDTQHFSRVGFCVEIEAHKRMEQALSDNRELRETKQELERYQLELEQKIEELNRSNFELSQFAYVASHDLQEPLRKIIYYSNFLQQKYVGLIDEQGTRAFSNMFSAAQRMKQLIHDLLSLSRIRKEDNFTTATDLNQIFQEALQDLEMTIREKGAQVSMSSLPVISANPVQMRQLFGNIISNAIKYCAPDTQPVIAVHANNGGNGHVMLYIRDNGIGFEEKYLEKMFSLFQRLHTRDKYEGTGIGLTICKKIVELHKGNITATSTPGIGSTFIITLPVN
ncbi:hypothetical protein GA0116948_10431 [Chitinophaga costaii]|uniref:histidine kinase n=1 Tax=Chitinophaga costaii TaxID=1335309 RepID=A0A1C4CAN6_9BACT|nr:ATP-binding protein [Chitinophaga costaii]PUZ27169.1 PAS domain S-box protein [Chitinophaga costaii]SCC16044.1 hypothetical protein GA0116948_10431 [Chitinophaga costaii]